MSEMKDRTTYFLRRLRCFFFGHPKKEVLTNYGSFDWFCRYCSHGEVKS